MRVTARLWAHAHFGKQYLRAGATRIAAMTGNSNLNVTAFANTDGSYAVQVINNGNDTQTVSLAGLNFHGRSVQTVLTNQANNLTQGYAAVRKGSKAIAKVPGKSLLSFYLCD